MSPEICACDSEHTAAADAAAKIFMHEVCFIVDKSLIHLQCKTLTRFIKKIPKKKAGFKKPAISHKIKNPPKRRKFP